MKSASKNTTSMMPNSLVVGFGSAGRAALSAVRAARAEGIKVGLLRPITLHPFPDKAIGRTRQKVEGILVVEMNGGQMLDDVRLAVRCEAPVEFYGPHGRDCPAARRDQLDEIRRLAKGPLTTEGHPRDRWMASFAPAR